MWDSWTAASTEGGKAKDGKWICLMRYEARQGNSRGFSLSHSRRFFKKRKGIVYNFFFFVITVLLVTVCDFFHPLFREPFRREKNEYRIHERCAESVYRPSKWRQATVSFSNRDIPFKCVRSERERLCLASSLPSDEEIAKKETSSRWMLPFIYWRSAITRALEYFRTPWRYTSLLSFSFPSPILFAEAVGVNYHGTVYRGVAPQHIIDGSRTFVVDVSVPVFPSDDLNATQHILICVLTDYVQLWDDEGKKLLCDSHAECDVEDEKVASHSSLTVVDHSSTESHTNNPPLRDSLDLVVNSDENSRVTAPISSSSQVLHSWKETVYKMVTESKNISVSWDRQTVSIDFAPVKLDNFPHNATLVVIPCFPLSLFEQLEAVGIGSSKHQCLEGAPFVIRWASFPRVPERDLGFLVTGKMISVPIEPEGWPIVNEKRVLSREMMERSVRVVLGTTCSRTRDAFVRGNIWDPSTNTYRFTPYRGGVHSLCFIPFPDRIPRLLLKLLPSFLIAGAEGLSTDPPLVRAEVEFTATIFGTNLSGRDTAVMTEELCSQFNPHQPTIHVLDLLFISPSRILFQSIFHKRGIFHVCYHRHLSPAYVRVSTMLVEMGKEVVVESQNANVLIDQDVKLLTSASVKKLKVQNKGNLVLNQTLNIASVFVWSGGTITGHGLLNTTGYGKVTTEGYETRALSVPLYNYGELVFDAQRVLIEGEGCIHNYGNLTLTVDSMASEGISSVTSMAEGNIIYNYPGSILRIIALQEDAVALLMARIVVVGGSVILSGKLSFFTVSTEDDAVIVVKKNSVVSLYQGTFKGSMELEEKANVIALTDTSLVGLTVFGYGTLCANGNGVVFDGIHVSGKVVVVIRSPSDQPTASSMSLLNTNVFDKETYLIVETVKFFIVGPKAWLLIYGAFVADLDHITFSGIFNVEVFSTALFFRSNYKISLALESPDRYLRDLFIHRDAVAFMVDNDAISNPKDTNEESLDSIAHCFTYFSVINMTVEGQLLLRGCTNLASVAQVSGTIKSLSEKDEWELLEMAYCKAKEEVTEVLKRICGILTQLHLQPSYSGILSRGETVVMSPAAIDVFELVSTRGFIAVKDELTIVARHQIIVKASRFALEKGGVLRTPSLRIAGLLELFEPLRSKVDGSVTVFKESFIRLRGVRQPCESFFSTSGAISIETPGDDIFHCVELNPGESDISRAVVSGLPLEVSCPPHILDYVRENYILFLFKRSPMNFGFEKTELPWTVMMQSCVLILMTSIIILRLMLCLHGLTVREWITAIKTPSPLRLTLSWNEFNMNPINYLSLVFFLIRAFQDFFCIFHPFLPVPLPYMRLFSLRNAGILFPHVLEESWLPLWLSVITIAWCVVLCVSQLVITNGNFMPSYVVLAAQHMEKAMMLFSIFINFFSTQLLSIIGDGVLCSTILKEEPSCNSFQRHNGAYLLVEFGSFFFFFIGTSRSYARHFTAKFSHDLLQRIPLHIVSNLCAFLQVSFWKVFCYYPMTHVVITFLFTLQQVTIGMLFPRTPFVNVNAFFTSCAAVRVPMMLLIFYYQLCLHMGWISYCDELTTAFLICIALSVIAFVSFLLIYLVYVRLPDGSVGDPSIDALRRSIVQIQIRIQEIKNLLPSLTDPIEIENIQNAISRLRVEFLEKHDQYDLEVRRLLHPFYFMHPMKEPKSVGTPSGSHQTLDFLKLTSPTTGNASFLTDDQMENFCCGPVLGKGSYGTVYMGILPSGKLVAVKYISLVSIREEVLNSVKGEVQMLMELSHPNIIRYYGAHHMDGTLMIFMEFAVGGSLASLVRKFSSFSEPVLQLYTVQILSGLLYLHQKGVIHRDIKGENILVDVDGISKLADFGSSKSLVSSNHSSVGTLVGSPFWMAPEVIRNEAYGIKADIWSVGCTVVEMLNGGEPPWKSQFDNAYSAMFYVGSTNDIPVIPEDTSELCRVFLYRCFERDPSKRASAEELLHHEWLASVPYRYGGKLHGGDGILDFPTKGVLGDTLESYPLGSFPQGPRSGIYDESISSSKMIQRLKSAGGIGTNESVGLGGSAGSSSGFAALGRQSSNLVQNLASSRGLERQSSEKALALFNLCGTPTTVTQKSFDEAAKSIEQKKTE